MPYPMTREGKKFCVNSKCYDQRAKALAYQRALYVNSHDAGKKELVLDAKYYDDYSEPYYGANKLSQDDPRVKYEPLGGDKKEACANCQFFDAGDARCDLVWGDIVATGYCELWLTEDVAYTQTPIPVTIVNKEKVGIVDWLKKTFGNGPGWPVELGIRSLPDNKWVAVYSNNFKDKAGQIFSEKSHDKYIEWLDKGLIPMPELWYWHIPGTKHGEADWVGRVGHLTIAAGHYDNTPMAQLFRKEYDRRQHKVSHTYGFPSSSLQDGVYNAYFAVEISPLPAGREANEITTFMEVKEMPVSEEKKTGLVAILGAKMAEAVLTDGEKISGDLEALGLKFKEAEVETPPPTTSTTPVDTGARDAIAAVAAAHKAQLDQVLAAVTTLAGSVKALTEGEVARQKQMDTLQTSVKEMFDLQPRASQSTQTIVDPKNPMAALLAEKAAEAPGDKPPASGNVFDWLAGMTLADKK